MEKNDKKYQIKISLNVLNHLGIKLYSNVPAVLSEVVANAWDADATKVEISTEKEKILIQDDGHGMSLGDINDKYLTVGYDRRKAGMSVTKKYKRPVMGRKGIGKLSLFSIANKIEIETYKDGEKNGLVLIASEIERQLEASGGMGTYHPAPIDPKNISLTKNGTRITITELKRNVTEGTDEALKKRVARRFSVLGSENKFSVLINSSEVKITDRDYFHKLQYIWYFGSSSKQYADHCSEKVEHKEKRDGELTIRGKKVKVTGWIGTVNSSGDLKDGEDNLNKIVVMVRGKLAQEDIMESFAEGGMYTKYIIGEIHADFLDTDDEEDIATTSRQSIINDDPRYKELLAFINGELKYVQSKWTDLRNKEGVKKATENKVIKQWFSGLKGDKKKKAESLFGKINQLTLESDDQRKTLFKHAILAFETLNYRENLDALENMDPSNVALFTQIFSEHNDIEATLYHQITKARVVVIKALQEKVEDNALEKVVQQHLYDNLWLLDPSWDRATEAPYLEQQVKTAFNKLNAKAKGDEKDGRVDIRYKNSAGKHIIIELKRPDRTVSTSELLGQVEKYRDKLSEILDAANIKEPVEVVCIVGKKLSDWKNAQKRDESTKSLAVKNIRVVLYQELIQNAHKMYADYLTKEKEVGRVFEIIKAIDES